LPPKAVVRNRMICIRLSNRATRIPLGTRTGRPYSQESASKDPRHSEWYRDMVPAMIPVALLGSAVYLGLQLARTKLSHEKQLVEAQERVAQLEAHLKHLESRIGNVSVEEVAPDANPTRRYWWW